jgi:hypothetical protein
VAPKLQNNEEHGLRVFENIVLREIFLPKRGENKWITLYNEKLHNLYSASNITTVHNSRRMRRAENVSRVIKTVMYRGLCWINLKERDHLQAVGVDRVDVIKMGIKEARWECMVGVHVAQGTGKMAGFSEYALCFTQFVSYEVCRKVFNFHLITNLFLTFSLLMCRIGRAPNSILIYSYIQ